MNKVMFFDNGNTAVFVDGIQVPELQRPWLELFCEFLEASGQQDPTDFEYTMPDGRAARPFWTGERWNWEIAG